MIRVLIADDHQIVRAGLRQFIADEPDIRVEGEAASGDEVMVRLRELEFDVVVLDISMPDRNGIDVLKLLRHDRELVRKKAVMALHRFQQLDAPAISHLGAEMRRTLCDKDPSVMAAALCLLTACGDDDSGSDDAAVKDARGNSV